ncbi:putative RNA recognition motif domain, mei2-like RNA recognition, RNA-binding domain superfamily [Helianthus annuus]|nr:putative RNA recognition motif domain, mei2-like RNA recognition, RNA-binding domain superfamily [Helianthus annuus]KAJ0679837.1 putative RNA recognition motif domain, mei2-like RNA recognition, RNA-binding domain superfamily [Helianthus annuus]KAJ0864583.1 putative mei2-like protein [Helianthus annuus]
MAEAGFHQFPLPLNPTAKEFRPTCVYYTFPPPPAFIIPALPPSLTVPTLALLLSFVPTHVSESTIRRELEVFGDVRAVQMEQLRNGLVTVHFYDLRHATEALNKIQEQHMQQQHRLRRHFDALTVSSPATPPPIPLPLPAPGLLSGRVIWAQFAFPLAAGLPDRFNQGTLIITSDSHVSAGAVREVFEAFGDVKEIREASMKKKQKLVEFYDTRAATKAVAAVNGQEINGTPVVVEFVRPTGHNNNNKLIPDSPPPREVKPLPCRKEISPMEKEVNSHCGVKKNMKSFNKPPEQWGRNKPWKGHRYNNRGKGDPRFLFKGDEDSRTTVMIKNIPNKYSQQLLLNMLDNHCIQCNEGDDNQPLSSYDFVYLPIDFVNKCNVGYGFVNMTTPEATRRLYKAFNHQNWEVFNSKKICELSYARLQGLEALKEHFKNSKFPCEVEEYLPVVFTPPRDGRTLTEPMPVVGRSSSSVTSLSEVEVEVEVGVGCEDLTDGDNNLLVEDTTQSDGSSGLAAMK